MPTKRHLILRSARKGASRRTQVQGAARCMGARRLSMQSPIRWEEAVCALLLMLLFPLSAQAALQETPVFAAEVAKGELPPVNRRVPREPSLAELETIGRPGGELRLL